MLHRTLKHVKIQHNNTSKQQQCNVIRLYNINNNKQHVQHITHTPYQVVSIKQQQLCVRYMSSSTNNNDSNDSQQSNKPEVNPITDSYYRATADRIDHDRSRLGILQRLGNEARYLQEHFNKHYKPQSFDVQQKPERNLSDLNKLTVEQLKLDVQEHKLKDKLRRKKELEGDDENENNDDNDDTNDEQEQSIDSKHTQLMIRDNSTVWDKRISGITRALRNSSLAESYRNIRRSFMKSDSTIAKLTRDQIKEFRELKEDVQDIYDRSQDRTVEKVRRIVDAATNESEQAFAYSELKKLDPTFNENELIEHLRNYMIPGVVSAFRRGNQRDVLLLNTVVEPGSHAEAVITALIKGRQMNNCELDNRVLDVKSCDVLEYSIQNHVPVIRVSFVCQHIDVTRNTKTNEIVEGFESNFRNWYYLWDIVVDNDNKYWDYRIKLFQAQDMLQLTSGSSSSSSSSSSNQQQKQQK